MLRMLIYVLNAKNDQKVRNGFCKYAGFIAACINSFIKVWRFNSIEIVRLLVKRYSNVI